jgi:DNA-directed RNA polymerase specialized sigma24 family protein
MKPVIARRDLGTAAPDALAATFTEHASLLLAAARLLTRNDADARDLVQATLEIAIRNAGDLRDPQAAPAWLLTIQAREAFRLQRRLARLIPLGPTGLEPVVAAPDAESVALRSALGRLSPRVRAAIVLHHMAGLTVAEVADALGVSPNTVKTQLRQGLARLRELLSDD